MVSVYLWNRNYGLVHILYVLVLEPLGLARGLAALCKACSGVTILLWG